MMKKSTRNLFLGLGLVTGALITLSMSGNEKVKRIKSNIVQKINKIKEKAKSDRHYT